MKRTVLITGATGAIGRATAFEFAKNNCRVILLARNQEKLSIVKSDIIKATDNKEQQFMNLEWRISVLTLSFLACFTVFFLSYE